GGTTFNFPGTMFQWTGGTIDLLGNTLTNAGTLNLTNVNNITLNAIGGQNNLGGTLENRGTIVQQGAGDLYLYDSVQLDNPAGSTYAFAGDGNLRNGNDNSV